MLGLSVSAEAGLWRVEQADLTALSGAGAGPASIHEVGVWLPDLSDPATLGCLLALVREAWGCHVHLRRWASPAPDMSGRDRSTWEPVDGLGRRLVAGPRVLCDTEAEALVAALEAAP